MVTSHPATFPSCHEGADWVVLLIDGSWWLRGLQARRCHSRGMSEATSQPSTQQTRVRLPADVVRPFEVFVNGVLQREGADYIVRDANLLFERPMKEEGKLGLIRWASITLGIAGSYKQNDSVDVAYERNGQKVVAAKLPLEPVE